MKLKYHLVSAILVVFVTSAGIIPMQAAQEKVITIAVLPFQNLSSDKNTDWIGYGFSETLSTKLSNVSTINIVERMQLSNASSQVNS